MILEDTVGIHFHARILVPVIRAPSPEAALQPNEGDPPQLIFFTELEAAALIDALARPGTLTTLAALRASVALALPELDDIHARAARLLQAAGIQVVAWLCLPLADGFALSLTNYPRMLEHYGALRAWAHRHDLHFRAIGLAVEPPADRQEWSLWRALRSFADGLWLARDNILYPSAYAAYIELLARMRHDGYEVHVYQLPFIADDRRAGTTLVQRALDIVDLPADLDVLICASDVPIDWLHDDLGGALIVSYGPSADAIGVGAVDVSEPWAGTLPWQSLRRDLLLAARYTDTIYIASLEYCVRSDALALIATLDWESPARASLARRALIGLTRALLLVVLLIGRFGYTTFAWAGWALALALWIRGRESGNRHDGQ
jgi:hypothetical protein